MSDLVRYTNKINKATQYFLGESKREPSKQEEDKQLQFDVYLTLVEHIVVGDYEKALGLAKKITASSSETNQVLSRRILNDYSHLIDMLKNVIEGKPAIIRSAKPSLIQQLFMKLAVIQFEGSDLLNKFFK